jgi:hypothetical protein
LDTARASWMAKAEAAIMGLRDVEGVSIQVDGEDIREIHVLSSSTRPAKQIVRDIQTLLLTRFTRNIDHRVVSVAFTTAPANGGTTAPAPATAGAPRAGGAPDPPPTPIAVPAIDDRIRFGSANLFVSGPRVQAQVELRWKGVPRMGSASGLSTRDGAQRLIAQATLAAIQEFLDEDIALSLEGLDIARLGRREIVVVGLDLIAHREHKGLSGCCTVEQDVQQAVVLATLAALNRVLGGLPIKEPTEYVLRPTSS